MYNFDQKFLAKINGVWTSVHGQAVSDYLICKHNGYVHWLQEQFERFDDDTSEEQMRKYAIKYNTADLDCQIERDREERLFAQHNQRRNQQRRNMNEAIEQMMQNVRRSNL